MTEYHEASFYQISQKIEGTNDFDEKLHWCEEGLKLLPGFVSDHLTRGETLPPIVFCRDVAPELYMRRGDWNNAERVIRFCMDCNAYYPETGEEILESFEEYRDAACMALLYIGNHPGTLQKDIYKKLEQVASSSVLKSIMRSSELIRKEKDEKTNRLYLADPGLVFPAIGLQVDSILEPAVVPLQQEESAEPTVLRIPDSVLPPDESKDNSKAVMPVAQRSEECYVLTMPKKRTRIGAGIAAAVLAALLGLGGYAVNNQIDAAATAAYSEGVVDAEAQAAADIRAAEQKRDQALSEAADAREEMKKAESEREKTASENDELNAQLEKLTAESGEKDAKIQSLQSDVDTLNTQLTEAKKTAEEAQAAANRTASAGTVALTQTRGGNTDTNVTRSTGNDQGGYTVYVTDSGTKYHNAGCRYLSNSSHAMSLSQAQAAGYTPCSVCH